ncbi:hypothetical protein SUGI_0204790 [Cryptomeria japonica]|nr:hypothetical protein SUGI_0204790 [Cryptomeria japonica]
MRKSHSASVCRCIWVCLLLLVLTLFYFQKSADQNALQLDTEINSSTRSKKLEILKEDEEDEQQQQEEQQNQKNPLVEEELELPRDADQDDDDCEGRRMYIYDLPPEFNTQILNFCDAYESWTNFCDHMKNEGFGPKTHRRSKSWYKTDVYMLELIFHARARSYDCRVMEPAEADLFFIPYYTGLDALRYLHGPDVNRSSEHGLQVVQWLSETGGSFWRRNGGSDHFVVMGRAAWDFSRSPWRVEGWGTSLLELPAMLNVTSLVLESRPFPWQEQAVPYPTAFHPAGSPSLALWTSRVRRSPRPFLFAFAGGGGTGVSPNVRRSIRTECSNSSALWADSPPGLGLWSGCSFISCDDGRCDSEPGYVMRAMMKANFCLQPPGDTPTRRATFDGIVAGCIPVFFEKQAAYTQYTWHLPADPKEYSVFINKDDVVFGGLKIGEVLANISRAEIVRMREKVIELIPRVVYRKPEATDVGFKDAFDFAIEGVLQRIKNRRNGTTTSGLL